MTVFYRIDSETDSELKEQIAHFEKLIPAALVALKLEQAELNELENSLSSFLEAYLAEVGGLFEELKDITAQVNYYSERIKDLRNGAAAHESLATGVAIKKIKKSIEGALNSKPFSENKFKEKEIKNIYHSLAKILQPEVIKGEKAVIEVFQLVNKLYTEKDLEGLIRLERKILVSSNNFKNDSEKLATLEKEHDDVLSALDSVRIRRHKLMISPAFELQKKFRMAEKTGKNLVSEVMQEVLGKIKERRKELLQKITYYKFLTAGSFEAKAELTSKLIAD